MKNCRKCGETTIRSRKNYSHGKKSRSVTTLTCKKCGSLDIEEKSPSKQYKRKKR